MLPLPAVPHRREAEGVDTTLCKATTINAFDTNSCSKRGRHLGPPFLMRPPCCQAPSLEGMFPLDREGVRGKVNEDGIRFVRARQKEGGG